MSFYILDFGQIRDLICQKICCKICWVGIQKWPPTSSAILWNFIQFSTGILPLLEYHIWSGDGWSSFQILQWRISLLWSKLEFDGRKPPKFWQYLLFLLFLIIVNQLHVLLLPLSHIWTLCWQRARPDQKTNSFTCRGGIASLRHDISKELIQTSQTIKEAQNWFDHIEPVQ